MTSTRPPESHPAGSPAAQAGPPPDAPSAPFDVPQLWLFRVFPLHIVLPVSVLALLVALAVQIFGVPSLIAAASAVGVALILLWPLRGRSLAAGIAERVGYRWQTRHQGGTLTHHAPFDAPVPDGGSYGMRWDGKVLTTMLRIDAHPDTVTFLSPSGLNTGDMAPLPEIARCLEQFDISLNSIDVISTGSRTSDAGQVAKIYEQVLGPLPAVAHRTVYVVLRFDPLANPAAVRRRGGDSTGTLRSAIIATRRVANRLAVQGLTVSVLSAAETTSAVADLTHHVPLDQLSVTPRSTHAGGIYFSTYRVAADMLGPRGLAEVWSTSSLATTVTIRLAKPPRSARRKGGRPANLSVTATVRFDNRRKPARPRIRGLIPITGKQRRLLLQTLPIGDQGPEVPLNSYLGTPESLTQLLTPIAGCGQVIGADSSGQGVALTLVGRHVRRVEIVGSVLVAKQVILRAIALGASVVVHTNRHEAWRPMVYYVGTPQSLSLAQWSAGSQQASVHHGANVFVYDGIPVSLHHSDATVISLRSPGSPAQENFDPEITMVEDPRTANLVSVHTNSGSTTVFMVATPAEMHYLAVPEQVSAA